MMFRLLLGRSARLGAIATVLLLVGGCGGGGGGSSTTPTTSSNGAASSGGTCNSGGDTISKGGWVWVSGSNAVNSKGSYGTLGTAASGNTPGARELSVTWTDAAGKLWLFGGYGSDSNGYLGVLNDLWTYSPSTGFWTWASGSNTYNAMGSYSISSSSAPPARAGAVSWIDASGNLWLFGGSNPASSSAVNSGQHYLNDLWMYSPATGQWLWMSGSSTPDAPSSYGVQGTAASSNVPGARFGATGWIDASGTLWLFGGANGSSYFNELWTYSPSTGQWTWVTGSNSADTYGTQGVAGSSNTPSPRFNATSWIDASGNLWLFGGYGHSSSFGYAGYLNDLWKYSPSTGLWTWMSGSKYGDAKGTYGIQGTSSNCNVPGARTSTASWIDASGQLWLFGGEGNDSKGALGWLSDMWVYSPKMGLWTWVSGSNIGDAKGIYGVQGTTASDNAPGGRRVNQSWIDASGNLWLFGGAGYGASGSSGWLNDLWKYTPQ